MRRSDLDTILDAVAGGLGRLNFTFDGTRIPVVKRKVAKGERGVDAATQITVSAAPDPDEMRPIAFGGVFEVKYRVEITLVAPNNGDQAGHLPEHLAFRERVRRLFARPPLAGAPKVIRLEFGRGPLLPRDLIDKGFDVQQVIVIATVIES